MTQHEVTHRIGTLVVIAAGFIAIGCLLVLVQQKDDADDQAMRAHVEQQRVASQPAKRALLDWSVK